MTDAQTEQPRQARYPNLQKGRPKGLQDKSPRYIAQFRELTRTTYGHIVDITRLAPVGRELDKVAICRAAFAALVGHLIGELTQRDEGADRRRDSLVAALKAVHNCEIETIKALPDMATLVGPGRPVPAGEGSPGDIVALHLPEFKPHKIDQDD